MSEFVYKATSLNGKTVEGLIEANDEDAVIQILHQMSYIPIKIDRVKEKSFEIPLRFQRVRLDDLIMFTQSLSNLFSSGLPIDRSLHIIAGLTENSKLKEIIKDLSQKIKEGKSLSEALGYHSNIFPKVYINMVKAGESGGFLELVLSRLSQYLSSRKELRDQILSLMLYPLILTMVSGLSVIILMTFVIPRFARIFSDLGQAIPVPTMVLIKISQTIKDFWWLGLGILLLFFLGLKLYNMDEERRFLWDKMKLRWVLLGDLLKKREVAIFSRTLGTLLQSGITILSALNLVREIPQNLAISRAILYIHDRLREGKSFSKSMEETGIFPSLAIEMAHVGEETGRLDEILIRVAETYETNIQMSLKRVISLLEPILILVMGGIVGFIVLSMLLAIFSINEIPF